MATAASSAPYVVRATPRDGTGATTFPSDHSRPPCETGAQTPPPKHSVGGLTSGTTATGAWKGQVYQRNEIMVALWANGARQVTLAPVFRLKSQGHVSRICNDPRWRDATELPPVEPEVLGVPERFGGQYSCRLYEGGVSINMGRIRSNGVNQWCRCGPVNACETEKSRLPRIQVQVTPTWGLVTLVWSALVEVLTNG